MTIGKRQRCRHYAYKNFGAQHPVGTHDRDFRFRFQVGEEISVFTTVSNRIWNPPSPLFYGYRVTFPPW
jgi:hypothetical protein